MTAPTESPADQQDRIYLSDGGVAHSESPNRSDRVRLCERLKQADLVSDRLIPLDAGSKSASIDHSKPSNRYDIPETDKDEIPDFVSNGGNYGVYAGNDLVILDIDDYTEEAERSAELDALPETFVTQSPHGGEHRYYVVLGDIDALHDATGTRNPVPTWGELQAHNKYVVGPGSQLEGCNKDWCDECATADGGYYTIRHDSKIATIGVDDLIDVVTADPTYSYETDSTDDEQTTSPPIDTDQIGFEGDVDQRLERALNADETLCALWNGNYAVAGFSDRSTAECALAGRLAFWFNKDRQVVRQLMDRADTQKWAQRTDDSYRESVLEAVGAQREVYTGEAAEASSLPEAQLSDLDVLQDEFEVSLTKQEAYDRCQALIRDAIVDGRRVLIEALPTIGKSVGAVEAVADTDVQATILTQREDLYEEARERCADLDLRYRTLPSVSRSCPTYQGNYGEAAAKRIRDPHKRGVSAREIHENFRATGNPLPCQHDGACPSKDAWDFDPDAYDVLIGHYLHANMEKATADRYVFIDEFVGDAFDTELEKSAANAFLEENESHFDTATDVLEARVDDGFDDHFQSLEKAVIENHLGDKKETNPLDGGRQHRYGAEGAYVLVASNTTVNEFDRVEMDEIGMIGLHDRRNDTIHLRDPPSFDDANAVICLDGTPTKKLWESALGLDLNHERVLTDAERRVYITEVMEWEFVQTTEYVYPYSSGENVNVDKDRALIEAIRQAHGEWPTLISTAKAIQRYRAAYSDLLEQIDHVHHGDLKGTNELREERLGVITGSRHYGRHAFIGKEAAFANEEIEPEGSGLDKTYNNAYGDKLLRHMREHETLQAMLRFGRDGDGARVYVHTAAIPEWVPRQEVAAEIRTHGDGMQQVLRVLKTADEPWTVRDVVDHEHVDISRKQVSNLLNNLTERDVLDKRQDGRANEYDNDGLDRVNEYGVVELDTE